MKIIGKIAWFWLHGYRSGKVLKVYYGKRTGLKAVTVRLAGMDDRGNLGHHGSRVKLGLNAFRGPMTGILHRGKLIPIQEAVAASEIAAAA